MSPHKRAKSGELIENWFGLKTKITCYMFNESVDQSEINKKNKEKQTKEKDTKKKTTKTNSERRRKKVKTNTFYKYLNIDKLSEEVEKECDKNFGDNYKKKEDGSTRWWCANPYGIGLNPKSSKAHGDLSFLRRKSKADIIGVSGTIAIEPEVIQE